MASWIVAINNTLLGDASLVRAQGSASPGDFVEVRVLNRKLKGYVLEEASERAEFTLAVLEPQRAPLWAVLRVLSLLKEYPLNAFELIDLARNWSPEPREIAFLEARNYIPQGPREKELLKLLRTKPLEITPAIKKRYGDQIEELSKLDVIRTVCLEPNSYGMMFAKLEAPNLLIPESIYRKYAGRWLPVAFWKRTLGPLLYDQILESGAIKEELRLVRTRKAVIRPGLAKSDSLPARLEELDQYLRFLMEKQSKTLVVFPSVQMARQYATMLLKKGLAPIVDSGGYTRMLQQAFVSRGAYLIVGTPRSLLRPWIHLENLLFIYKHPRELSIRTASQRIPAHWMLPPVSRVEYLMENPHIPVLIKNVAGMTDVAVLAYLKQKHRHDIRQLYFVNRLGFSTSIQCKDCGWVMSCSVCGTPMRYHRKQRKMICHRCGHTEPVPSRCVRCGSLNVSPVGIGAERLELQLSQKILRSARDLNKSTIISTAKLFRYLPLSGFDEVLYVSADADLASPVLIPELRFKEHLHFLCLWAKPESGYVEVITRDPVKVENAMKASHEQLTSDIGEGTYTLEVHSHELLPNLEGTQVFGPVPVFKKKAYRYVLLTQKKPSELIKGPLLRHICFVSFDPQ
ncbi:hypothetical protein HPY42_05035 [Coprothermobacteraceae bacterium]|nr:hypothetical protein [Coprothermobacteraceae bacterium]